MLLTPTFIGSLIAGVACWLLFWFGVSHGDSIPYLYQYLSRKIIMDWIRKNPELSLILTEAVNILLHGVGTASAMLFMARREDWHRNGQNCRLGHYQLDWMEANGTVHTGCHIVAWDEIKRIATEVEEYEPLIKCTQCQMLSINGVPCHETGCPNSNKVWSIEENDWIATCCTT